MSPRVALIAVCAVGGCGVGAALPRVVAAFHPHDGPPRRAVPSTPVLAAATAGVCAAVAARLAGRPAALPAYAFLGVIGVALVCIDARSHRLPDALTRPAYPITGGLLILAALVEGEQGRVLRALAAMAMLWAVFRLLWWLGGVGYGDVRVAGLLGLGLGWLSWPATVRGVGAGLLLGGLGALGLVTLGRASRATRIAYGPFLLAGGLVGVLTG